jgi:glycosyltransferase involved in cell wall biosynthesis
MERRASPPGVSLLRGVISRVSSPSEVLDHRHGKRIRQGQCGDGRPRPSKPRKARQALGQQRQEPRVILSVVIITHNEEANIGRTLASVQPLVADGKGEVIIVDSGSTDRTVEIVKSFGAKVFVEEWKGYAAQKNSAIDKAIGDYVFALDADEEVSNELTEEIQYVVKDPPREHKLRLRLPDGTSSPIFVNGFLMSRKNYFLGRWIRHGGFWPDRKLRLFRRGSGRFGETAVHETLEVKEYKSGMGGMRSKRLNGTLIHHSYPTLADYIDHMNHYSSLGAEMAATKRRRGFSLFNIVLRPLATFIYNYFFRLGLLDGCEGLLLHLYHAVYVSWKYSKAWELGQKRKSTTPAM